MADNSQLLFNLAGDSTLKVQLRGIWRLRGGRPSAALVEHELESARQVRDIAFDTRELTSWDSSVLTFLVEVSELCRQRRIPMNREGLPVGVQKLLALAEAVPERKGARREATEASLLERIGTETIGVAGSLTEMLAFLGEMTITFVRLFGMKARYRASDLFLLIQQFGAQIYVADLVGIAMMREMGAMMTGIIMAGRTGAAFAAQIGTMKVTQEVDAFTTAGFSPLEFLVLPRVMALILMMPLLCLYADFVGVIGGAVIGVGMLDLSWTTYFNETANAISLTDMFGGVFKASVYGVLIALSGCLRGLQCGNSSSAVGDAATSAVVTGIVAIVMACGIFAVVFYILGI